MGNVLHGERKMFHGYELTVISFWKDGLCPEKRIYKICQAFSVLEDHLRVNLKSTFRDFRFFKKISCRKISTFHTLTLENRKVKTFSQVTPLANVKLRLKFIKEARLKEFKILSCFPQVQKHGKAGGRSAL